MINAEREFLAEEKKRLERLKEETLNAQLEL